MALFFECKIFIPQCQRLQTHLDVLKSRLKDREEANREEERRYRIIEDELVSEVQFDRNLNLTLRPFCSAPAQFRTRLNYEEQISVLTEQVISLSDQLAKAK